MTIRKSKIEKFSLCAIAGAVRGSDLLSARSALSFAVGAVLDVSGRVQKVVKREGKLKLVVEPCDTLGFVVFAECLSDAENLRKHKIRKGSLVSIRGKFQSFGAAAVCLSDCQLADSRGKAKPI